MITTTLISCQSLHKYICFRKPLKYLKLIKHLPKFITIFFLFLFFNTSFLQAQQQLEIEVDLSYTNKNLKFILKDIASQYPVNFSYGKVKLNTIKNIEFKGKLAQALDLLFQSVPIQYKCIGNQIVLKYNAVIGKAIKGRILDQDTKLPLIGANITIRNSNPLKGTSSDENGYFKIEDLGIDRYDLEVQYIGYEPTIINQVLVSTGKEIFLEVELREQTLSLAEIVVDVNYDLSKPLNDMASTSARSFSVEESQRYAAAISDPARMVQSYAGITGGGDDLSNEIIIRGNSSRGILWRLEGIEIPNPNHFGGLGSGAGSVSMLSSSVLTNSDFYTGAFPAEFGNALSGVFDMQMRNGNKDKREHTFKLGNLGMEFATEGYFHKNSNASYLINIRLSTLKLIDKYLVSLGRNKPSYRDISFKVNVPTKKLGTFSLFGLGGVNKQEERGPRDTSEWTMDQDEFDFDERQKVGVIGLTHRYLLSDKSYIKNAIVGSIYNFYDLTHLLIPEEQNLIPIKIDESFFNDKSISISSIYNLKINAKHKIRTGVILNDKYFDYDYKSVDQNTQEWITYLDNKGRTQHLQSFFQWRYRMGTNWELNAGLNFSYLFLNKTYGIDPRIALKRSIKLNQNLSFSLGLHSKPEHSSTYFIERIEDGVIESPNINLKMMKAIHAVVGYDILFSKNLRLKLEGYYQYLFHIPISDDPDIPFSVVNFNDVFGIVFGNNAHRTPLVSKGKGFNYGIDLTFEKFFSHGYYFLFTSSFYDSKYTTIDKKVYHTVNANNVVLNLLGGKEWKVGRRKKNIFGINTKFLYYDGIRDTPIDLATSINAGQQVFEPESFYSNKLKAYLRLDLGILYKVNTKKATHSFHLDIQNILDRSNIINSFYDDSSKSILYEQTNGLIPFLVYRLEMSFDNKTMSKKGMKNN